MTGPYIFGDRCRYPKDHAYPSKLFITKAIGDYEQTGAGTEEKTYLETIKITVLSSMSVAPSFRLR